MKRLLLSTFTVFIIAIGLSAYFYLRLDAVIPQQENPLQVTVDFLNHDTTDFDIIFIGSSRVFFQINPAIIDSVLHVNSRCIALDGSTIAEQLILLKKYKEHHKAPKLIVLGLDYTSLHSTFLPYNYPDYYEYMNDTSFSGILKQIDYHFRYKTFYERYDNFIRKSARTDYQKFAAASSIAGLHKNFDNLSDEPSWLSVLQIFKGYAGINKNWSPFADKELASPMAVKYDKLGVEFLDEFISTSQQYPSNTLLVFPPVYTELRKKANSKELFSEITKASYKYKVPFLDYTGDSICDKKQCFYNAWHLNKTGSDIFSEILAKDIQNYLEQKKKPD